MRRPTRAQLQARLDFVLRERDGALQERDAYRERAAMLERALAIFEKNMTAFSQANATMADGLSHVLNRALDLHKLKGER